MSRLSNRQIKAEFWEDDDLLQLPRDARWLFEGLWHLAEDSGCVKDSPFQFKIKLFASPMDADLTVERLAELRDLLIEAGFLKRYTVAGTDYLYIANFHKHQTIKNPNAPKEVPLPPWIVWEPYESNPRAGRYVVSETGVSGPTATVSQTSEDRQTDTSDSRFSGSQVLSSKVLGSKEGEEREEGEEQPGDLAAIVDCYHKRIGMIGPTQYEKLRFWHIEKGMEAAVVCLAFDAAIKEATRTNDPKKRRMSYIEGILRNWYNDGIRTLADLKSREPPKTEEDFIAAILAKAAQAEEVFK